MPTISNAPSGENSSPTGTEKIALSGSQWASLTTIRAWMKTFFDTLYATGAYPTGHLHGLTLSNDGTDPTNDLDIAAGNCRDDTDAQNMVLDSALVKKIDAAWAVGTNDGMLDTGTVSGWSSTVTMTIASPCVVTWNSHPLAAGDKVVFATTGALPTGLTAGTTYYVISAGLTASAFEISATPGGAAINTSGSQSGTHTVHTEKTYHIYQILRSDTGVVDILASLSASSPTMPASYDYKRRIGSIIWRAGAIKPFVQNGDKFMWSTPVADVSDTNPGISALTKTFTVPFGIKVDAILSIQGTGTANTDLPGAIYFSDLEGADVAPSGANGAYHLLVSSSAASVSIGAITQVMTNASAQVRMRVQTSTASTVVRAAVLGWIDTRGRLS